MLADFATELLLEPDDLSCLQRMVARSQDGGALTMRKPAMSSSKLWPRRHRPLFTATGRVSDV